MVAAVVGVGDWVVVVEVEASSSVWVTVVRCWSCCGMPTSLGEGTMAGLLSRGLARLVGGFRARFVIWNRCRVRVVGRGQFDMCSSLRSDLTTSGDLRACGRL
jgi:hypothetical protein